MDLGNIIEIVVFVFLAGSFWQRSNTVIKEIESVKNNYKDILTTLHGIDGRNGVVGDVRELTVKVNNCDRHARNN